MSEGNLYGLAQSRPTAIGMLDQKALILDRRLKGTRLLADIIRKAELSADDEQAVWSLLCDIRT